MIPIKDWLANTVGFDLNKYDVLIQKFHELQLFTIEDLHHTSREKITHIFYHCDIILEEWEALAFFAALDKLELQVVVSSLKWMNLLIDF